MKKYVPRFKSVYLIASAILFYVCPAFAQNEGIGTFSDLVGQAVQASAQPAPTPKVTIIGYRINLAGEKEPVITKEAPPLFSAPAIGFEYDYRRNQQKPPGGLTIDVNEAHTPFSFRLASTNFAFEYVHIWSDGSMIWGGNRALIRTA